MLFWKSLWKNDHAITYLSEKHLTMGPRQTWASIPKWVKILGLFALGGLGLMSVLAVALMVIQDGLLGLYVAGFGFLILCLYGTAFWGVYRSWTLGTLLSKLRQGQALPTFLYTAVSVEDTVDVLAARTLRQILAFVMFPACSLFFAMMAFRPWQGPSQGSWELLLFLVPVLSYFAVLGAFGLMAVHAALGESAPKALGKGMFVCIGSIYVPTILGAVCVGVLPEAAGIVGALIVIYYLYLPFLFRKLAINWLKAEPCGPKRGLVSGLLEGAVPVIPKLSGAFLFRRLADSNPVLARNLSSQNLLHPLSLGLGLLALTSLMFSSLGADLQQNQQLVWFEVHIVTWITAVCLAVAAFANSQSTVSREKQSRSLEVLRSTPLPARVVIDGWAIGGYWAYFLAAAGLVCWQLPGSWEALIFALSLPVCAAYGGVISGLKDSTGAWIWGGAAGVIFLSWVGLPVAIMSGAVHAHAGLAVFLIIAAWYLRRRALLVYGG